MEQTLIKEVYSEILFEDINDYLKPDFDVCGADNDKSDYWNRISGSFNDFFSSTNDKEKRIFRRYFGQNVGRNELLKSSMFLSTHVCKEIPKCKICPLKFHCSYYRKKADVQRTISFADFFCGAGGLSLGFELAGLYPALANDIDPWFVATYRYNRPDYNTEISACDIVQWLKLHQQRTDWDIDVVSGGVPCQSFSNANRQRKELDPRDKLYTSLMTAAGLIKPKVILIENVSGMIKEFDGVESDLKRLGYDAEHIIINSKDYGIPQNRRRLFFIAFSKEHFSDSMDRARNTIEGIKAAEIAESVTLRDAIGDLPVLRAHTKKNDTKFNNDISGRSFMYHRLDNTSDYVLKINEGKASTPLFNHKARYNNQRDVEIFGTLKPGENSLADSIKHIMPYSNRNDIFKDKYYKLSYDTFCKTITAHMRYDCNMYIHPEQARGLTAREAARVQSFPDDYVFLGNFQRLYQQVGNAVPPLLAKMLGSAIKENLD